MSAFDAGAFDSGSFESDGQQAGGAAANTGGWPSERRRTREEIAKDRERYGIAAEASVEVPEVPVRRPFEHPPAMAARSPLAYLIVPRGTVGAVPSKPTARQHEQALLMLVALVA